MICAECDAPNTEDALFCEHCGRRLDGSNAEDVSVTKPLQQVAPSDRLFRCRACERVTTCGTSPCFLCQGPVLPIATEDRVDDSGTPRPYCHACAALLGTGRFCQRCGADTTMRSTGVVIPERQAEGLAVIFDGAGFRAGASQIPPTLLASDEQLLIAWPSAAFGKQQAYVGRKRVGKKYQLTSLQPQLVVVTDRRIISMVRLQGMPKWIRSLQHIQALEEKGVGKSTHALHLPLLSLAGFHFQSASPWSWVEFLTAPSDDHVEGTSIQWKTGPGMLSTLAVGMFLQGNDSSGAADRLATGAGMAAWRSLRSSLSPGTLFSAFDEIYAWVCAFRGGTPSGMT